MKDQLRKAMLVGLGLAVVTKEKAEKVAKELMKKGELNEKDAKALVNKVAEEIDRTRARVEKEVRKELDSLMRKGAQTKKKVKKRKR